jgi:hypothetical protein
MLPILFEMRGQSPPETGPARLANGYRSIMYRRIAVCMVLCGIVASLCVYICAEALFTSIYSGIRDSSAREAEERLALFNMALGRIERDSLAKGRLALLELARRYPDLASVAGKTPEALAAEARSLGVSESYFIDASGRVFATSFKPDLGLELPKLG